jgi:hypothetical protein
VRYVTMPRWIYYMLIVMGVGFAAGAVPFWLFVPVSGHFVALVWVVMGAGFVFFSVRALVSRREDEQIARTGTAANATVLDAGMTGMFINNVPQWKLRLRIEGYGAPYETTVKLLTFNPPSNGDTFSVRIDPARKDHVVFASDDAAPASAPGIASGTAGPRATAANVQASVLEALRKAGLGDGQASTTVNPDGSRTIVMGSAVVSGSGSAQFGAADTVKALGDLEKLRESGAVTQDEFERMKRKLLGET